MKKGLIALLGLALGIAACGGTAGDPKVVGADDLNYSKSLMGVRYLDSGAAGIELQWSMMNNEEELRGYNVYIFDGSLDELITAAGGDAALRLALTKGAIERGETNTAVFEAFGFPTVDADDSDEAPATFVTCNNANGSDISKEKFSVGIEKVLTDIGSTVDDDTVEAELTKNVGKLIRCQIPLTTELSSSATAGTRDTLELGDTVTAFVVSVQGDDADEVSVTSEFIEVHVSKISTGLTTGALAGETYYRTMALPLLTTDTYDVIDSTENNQNIAPNEFRLLASLPMDPVVERSSVAVPAIVISNLGGRILLAGNPVTNMKVYLAPRFETTITTPDEEHYPLNANTKDTVYKTDYLFDAYKGSKFDIAVDKGGTVYYGTLLVTDWTGTTPTFSLLMDVQKPAGSFVAAH